MFVNFKTTRDIISKIYKKGVHVEEAAECQPQESRREGWRDAAIMLCKLNKSL